MTAALAHPPDIWDADERIAWAPPRRLTPSAWADRHRNLPRNQSNLDGPWQTANAPYLRGIMDLAARRGIVEMNLVKAAQIGISEALRNLIGFWACEGPDPVGLTLPNERKGRKIVENRLIPMFVENAVFDSICSDSSHDLQKSQLKLRSGWILHLMWSGSPASMASDPMRRVVNDEVDKFEPWAGQEADAVTLTAKRLQSFGPRRLQINASTPTTREGPIWKLYEASDMTLHFAVPCPRCGAFQKLLFTQLRWEKFAKEAKGNHQALARLLVRRRAVWYECAACHGRIEPSERDAMVSAGRWASDDGSVEDAEAVPTWPDGSRLGFQVSALYCRWIAWSDIAAEFLRADSLQAKMDFYTQTLGEVFEQQLDHAPAVFFRARCREADLPEGRLPKWAVKVLVTVDTQATEFYVVARAWGPGMKSQRVWHGRVPSFEDLDALCFRTPFAYDAEAWDPIFPDLVLIDSGGTRAEGERASRTMEVYRWVLGRGRGHSRVRAIKGASRSTKGLLFWPGKGFYRESSGPKTGLELEIPLWFVDWDHCADELAEAMHAGEAEGTIRRWFLNQRDDEEYNLQMSAMRKVVVRRGGQARQEWIAKPVGARRDYWDCERYQFAAAYMQRVHLLPPEEQIEQLRVESKRIASERSKAPPRPKRDPWKPGPL